MKTLFFKLHHEDLHSSVSPNYFCLTTSEYTLCRVQKLIQYLKATHEEIFPNNILREGDLCAVLREQYGFEWLKASDPRVQDESIPVINLTDSPEDYLSRQKEMIARRHWYRPKLITALESMAA